MKELLISAFIAIQAFLGIGGDPVQEFGATVLRAPGGGTGIGSVTAGDVGNCLAVADDSPFTWEVVPCGSGGGGVAGAISTTTDLVNTYVVYSTGVASIANDAGMTYSAAGDRLTVVNASTTNFSSTYASSTRASIGTLSLPNLSNGGLGVFGGLVSSGATTTAGTGLTYSGNAFNVNTSQNIATLSNLTSNGFVKTSGGDGTLSVDTTTYESGLTAGDGLTRTVNDFDCDTASGSVFGCLSSTDWTTFNNKIGLSSLSATWPIVYNSGTGAFTFTGLSTTTNSGLSQGFAYIGSGGLFQTVSTSTALASKQDVLVSGTNIKTINGSSILGSGDLTVTGSGSGLASSTPWTFGSLVVAKDNGSVTTISTSTIGTSQLTNDANFVDGTGVTNALVGWVDSNTVQATGTTHSLYVPSIFASTTNLNTFKGDVEVGTENGGPYLETGGADASPPFAFRNDRDTGMYSAGANALGFATGGTNRLTISSTGNLTFGYSSSTAYSSFEHASTTNFTFGGVTADTWPEFCETITGSADLCDGSDASGAGGSSAYEMATTSDIAVPQVAYFTKTGGRTTLGSIATGTISVPTGLTITANRYALGGSAAIGLDTGYVIPLQSTLDGKEDDLTFNWPLTRSTNTISWGGLSTTTNLTVGHIPFVSGANTFSSRATTSASCAGSVSCTGFDILGSSPITITGTDSTASTTLLGDTNSWSGVNRFSLASTTYHSFGTASTTNLNIGGDTFIDLTGTGLAVSGGVLNTSNIPNASLANSTISGISLGSNLNSLSNDATLNGSSYNGSSAISDWGLNLANANNWTALQTFLNASSTLFSARQAYFGGSATTTIGLDGSIVIPSGSNLTITGKSDGCATFASGVLNSTGSACGSGGGITALGSGYASTTDTTVAFSTTTQSFNGLTIAQRIIPTAGALTFTPNITGTLDNTGLTNSTISGIALGSNLADLTATNGTLTFSGTYNGGTARTIGLNLANANVWTAKQDFFGAASSTLFSANWGAFGATGTTTINTLGQLLVGTTTPWLNSMANFVGTTTVKGQLVSLAASTTANTTQTIDWSSGNTQKIMLTGNTSIVVNSTSSNPIDGGKYTLRICQDPTGSRTLTWANPISLRWWNGTTTITSTANKCTMIGMVYTAENGNNIYSIVASSTNIDIK